MFGVWVLLISVCMLCVLSFGMSFLSGSMSVVGFVMWLRSVSVVCVVMVESMCLMIFFGEWIGKGMVILMICVLVCFENVLSVL